MKASSNISTILFADAIVEKLEPEKTLPNKFQRLLKKLKLEKNVNKKSVGIKMHFGAGTGYTTIHPVFIRILVEELKKAGASKISAMDNDPSVGIARGYTREVLGCDVISTFGANKKYLYKEKINFKSLKEIYFGGEAVDCDFFIDLAHVKGHGACGFGGSLKNIAMGVTPAETRKNLHLLEGGIEYKKEKCVFCGKCYGECKNNAINFEKKKKTLSIFHHNCVYCQHCVLICPEKAIVMGQTRFEDFSKGMALVTTAFLKKFRPENLLFINFIMDLTIFCDCWGMSTPSLIPDIGILASDDITAIETASLDLIEKEQLIPKGLPVGRTLRKGNHIFERIHGKNPYLMINYLKEFYGGNDKYKLEYVH